MSKKPVNLQDSFPEICETLKHDNKNDEVKTRSTNKTTKPHKTSYQLCQVLQDPKDPRNVTVVKETFSKQSKIPANAKEPNAKARRFIYCKEVVKPYIRPDGGQSPDEIAACALSILEADFPKFKYCCAAKNQHSPHTPIDNCMKKDKKKYPPPYREEKEEKREPCSSTTDNFCRQVNTVTKAAKSCIQDICTATGAAFKKINDMSKTSREEKDTEPPPHPKCPKPKGCSMNSKNRVNVLHVDNSEGKITLIDKAFNLTKTAVDTVTETKHYLTKFHSIHSLLLLPLDEFEKQDEELKKLEQPAQPQDKQEELIMEEQKEDDKLQEKPLDNIHPVDFFPDEHKNLVPTLVSLSYTDDVGDDDDDDDEEDDADEDEDEDEDIEMEDNDNTFQYIVSENENDVEQENYIENLELENIDYDDDDAEDTTFSSKAKTPSFFSGIINKVKKTIPTTTNSENIKNKVSDAVFGSKDPNESEDNFKEKLKSTIVKKYDKIVERMEGHSPNQSTVSKMFTKYAGDQSSKFDIPTTLPENNEPVEVSETEFIEESTEDKTGFLSRLKSKVFSMFDEK